MMLRWFATVGAASLASVASAAEKGAAPDPLATDPDLAIWTLLIFLAMLAILRAFAWGPIMEALKARESGIAANLAEADAKHAEAKRLLDEHRVTLAGAAEQVRAMLDEARRDAEATKASIVEEAKAASEAERARVVRDIEQARDSAVRQLAERSAGLAIDLAAKVVKQDLTPQRQSEIVREALTRFAPNGPSAN
jgi:F-type H+-transporting ATPase subunit b